jgi:hypothetical protein
MSGQAMARQPGRRGTPLQTHPKGTYQRLFLYRWLLQEDSTAAANEESEVVLGKRTASHLYEVEETKIQRRHLWSNLVILENREERTIRHTRI